MRWKRWQQLSEEGENDMKVVLAGAFGNLGADVLKALLAERRTGAPR